MTSSGTAVARVCLVPAQCLMGCGPGGGGVWQIVLTAWPLSILVVPTSDPCQGFLGYICLDLDLPLLRGVVLGSQLKAWALWERRWKRPIDPQS